MNLAAAINVYIPRLSADADDISLAVRKVFNKKTGKGRGYDAISEDITNTAISQAEKIVGPLDAQQLAEIDDYVATRLGYIKDTFSKLNDPMKDKSDERAALVGDTEEHGADQYGQTKGYEWSGRPVLKQWTVEDPCDICSENEDEGPISVGEVFPSGDYAPPAHPNCRCWIEYIEEEEE